MQRRDQILVDALADHLAIERDIVHVADDDDLGSCVADFGKRAELGEEFRTGGARLDHDEVRRRRLLVVLHGGGNAAHVNRQMRLGEAAILAGALNGATRRRLLAEGMDRDARHRLHYMCAVIFGGDMRDRRLGRGPRLRVDHRRRLVDDFLVCDVAHWLTLLTAPES